MKYYCVRYTCTLSAGEEGHTARSQSWPPRSGALFYRFRSRRLCPSETTLKPGTQLGAPVFASDDERDVAVAAPKAIACFDIIKALMRRVRSVATTEQNFAEFRSSGLTRTRHNLREPWWWKAVEMYFNVRLLFRLLVGGDDVAFCCRARGCAFDSRSRRPQHDRAKCKNARALRCWGSSKNPSCSKRYCVPSP